MKISVPVNHNFHEEAPIREADLGNVFNVNKSGVKHLRQIIFSSVYELKLGAEQLKQVKVFNFKVPKGELRTASIVKEADGLYLKVVVTIFSQHSQIALLF